MELRTHLCVEEIALVNRLHLSPASDNAITERADDSESHIALSEPSAPILTVAQVSKPTSRKSRRDCEKRRCPCSCHRMTQASGRFWALEFSPLAAFQQGCDESDCSTSQRGVRLGLILPQLGIRWHAFMHLNVEAASGSCSIRAALEIQSVVDYDSGGFGVITSWERGVISFKQARAELIDLSRSNPTFKNQVLPNGKGYLQVNDAHHSWRCYD